MVASQPFTSLSKNYSDTLEYIFNNTGLTEFNYQTMLDLYNGLLCMQEANLLFPYWLNQSLWETIKDLTLEVSNLVYSNSKLLQLRAGPLLNELLSKMNSSSDSEISVHVYVTSPEHLFSLLTVLNSRSKLKLPAKGSVVSIELKNEGKMQKVDFWYLDGDNPTNWTQIVVNNDTNQRLLQTLEQQWRQMIPSNWAKACHKIAESSAATQNTGTSAAFHFFIVITITIINKR